mmetsp:Transcript_41790/g.129100  ORF Transcript_41790/g.129100 Transcript_41790/m.129100 type:complete len:240 (-) Transcript_41790:484-1203(-)
MAVPIAVSSWNTFSDAALVGSTVLELRIVGSGSTPLYLSRARRSAGRLIHRLFVLKKRCLPTFWNSGSSAFAHCADSRSKSAPVLASRARWPPFLSDSVRWHTSMRKSWPSSARYVSNDRSSVAPRLSLLETNMYLNPFASSASSAPDDCREQYSSPCPGGHHSFSGPSGYAAGFRVACETLGVLPCITSTSEVNLSPAKAGYLLRYALVSSLVLNEFMSMKRTSLPVDSRKARTCCAM